MSQHPIAVPGHMRVLDPVQVRPVTDNDVTAIQALTRAVNWPHRVEDVQFALALGQGSAVEIDGTIRGVALWWVFGPVARIGLVVVDPAAQRLGIGARLMDSALKAVEGVDCVIVNATAAGAPLYARLGFVRAGLVCQHQGATFSSPIATLRPGERVRPLGRADADRIVELDAGAGGAPRPGLVAALIDQGSAVVLDDGGETVGFAFYRRFGRGHLIGPVVARDVDGARALIGHWLASNPGIFIRIDVPAASGLSPWLESLGLVPTAPVDTMVKGTLPKISGPFRTFGHTSQALG